MKNQQHTVNFTCNYLIDSGDHSRDLSFSSTFTLPCEPDKIVNDLFEDLWRKEGKPSNGKLYISYDEAHITYDPPLSTEIKDELNPLIWEKAESIGIDVVSPLSFPLL